MGQAYTIAALTCCFPFLVALGSNRENLERLKACGCDSYAPFLFPDIKGKQKREQKRTHEQQRITTQLQQTTKKPPFMGWYPMSICLNLLE